MRSRKILFGVTGIGYGHTYRQMPLIDHFARKNLVMIFAYGRSYECYQERYQDHPNVKLEQVAVPFWVGNERGLDFAVTASHPENRGVEFLEINCQAMERAGAFIGKPDLVITDYEPVSAQYAYAMGAPLVTIDQQSKYLCGDFPPMLGGHNFSDEIARLRMFFPKAEARIACSFFDFPRRAGAEKVKVFPPVLRESIIRALRSQGSGEPFLLVYISSARQQEQSMEEILDALIGIRGPRCHLFLGRREYAQCPDKHPGIDIYQHGDPRFGRLLESCRGIVATAGHSLLSEAMYLAVPVYAMPVAPYEQHMNAAVIAGNGFGLACPRIERGNLRLFAKNLGHYQAVIREDKKVLLRGAGQRKILKFLEGKLRDS
jgi:uncharacterized protein (TIGR00661 family)